MRSVVSKSDRVPRIRPVTRGARSAPLAAPEQSAPQATLSVLPGPTSQAASTQTSISILTHHGPHRLDPPVRSRARLMPSTGITRMEGTRGDEIRHQDAVSGEQQNHLGALRTEGVGVA